MTQDCERCGGPHATSACERIAYVERTEAELLAAGQVPLPWDKDGPLQPYTGQRMGQARRDAERRRWQER